MKHRILSLLTAGCTAVTMFSAAISNMTTTAADQADDPLKIMAIGDSITDGYINGDNGYRKYLCYYLQQAGIAEFDMVGSQDSWTDSVTYTVSTEVNGIPAGTTFDYDPANEGYSGYTIQTYNGRTGIYETLFNDSSNYNAITQYDPDLILLQIGTNDVLDAHNDGITARLEVLIDKIFASANSDAALFVASIPYIDVDEVPSWVSSYEWTYGIPSYFDDPENYMKVVTSYVDAYNASIRNLVEEKQSDGYHIFFSDVNSVVNMETGLYDGVHPNEYGYACMGQLWANLILDNLDNASVTTSPTVTTTTTEETTVTTTNETTATEATSSTIESTTTSTETTVADTTATPAVTTVADTPFAMGDVNLDGTVNLADAVVLQKYLLGENTLLYEKYYRADLTFDGAVNGFDFAKLRQILVAQDVTA